MPETETGSASGSGRAVERVGGHLSNKYLWNENSCRPLFGSACNCNKLLPIVGELQLNEAWSKSRKHLMCAPVPLPAASHSTIRIFIANGKLESWKIGKLIIENWFPNQTTLRCVALRCVACEKCVRNAAASRVSISTQQHPAASCWLLAVATTRWHDSLLA